MTLTLGPASDADAPVSRAMFGRDDVVDHKLLWT